MRNLSEHIGKKVKTFENAFTSYVASLKRSVFSDEDPSLLTMGAFSELCSSGFPLRVCSTGYVRKGVLMKSNNFDGFSVRIESDSDNNYIWLCFSHGAIRSVWEDSFKTLGYLVLTSSTPTTKYTEVSFHRTNGEYKVKIKRKNDYYPGSSGLSNYLGGRSFEFNYLFFAGI